MKKYITLSTCIVVIAVLFTACDIPLGGDPALEQTRIALAVQQTSLALDQSSGNQPVQPQTDPQQPVQPTYTTYPTYTVQAPEPEQPQPEQPQPEQPQPEQPTLTLTPTLTLVPTQEDLFENVTVDKVEFYCDSWLGPTTLTITVDMSDIDRGGNLFWRLHEKATDVKLDWEVVDMLRSGSDQRTYTFDADIWAGTENFWYPGGMVESWFEFQIISNDGADRTDVFADVTFYPCP